jgi:hypothetical protein
MKVETKWWIEQLTKKRDEAPNSVSKKMYSKQIKNLEAGRCPYGCVDYKKEMEISRDKYIK